MFILFSQVSKPDIEDEESQQTPRYVCGLCHNFGFNDVASLSQHMATEHSEYKGIIKSRSQSPLFFRDVSSVSRYFLWTMMMVKIEAKAIPYQVLALVLIEVIYKLFMDFVQSCRFFSNLNLLLSCSEEQWIKQI